MRGKHRSARREALTARGQPLRREATAFPRAYGVEREQATEEVRTATP